MTTPYASKNQWAQRTKMSTWAAYATEYSHPTEGELDSALEDATDLMNDSEHINCKSTNITNTDYTQRLERICVNVATRMLQVRGQYDAQGTAFTWSPQDFLYTFERNFLLTTAIELGYRVVGGIG